MKILSHKEEEELKNKVYNIAKANLNHRFLIGRNWNDVPIRNDMIRKHYWVYNTEIDKTIIENGIGVRFIKFSDIPINEVAESLEWRSIDCLHYAKLFSGCSDETAESDLKRSVISGVLDITLLEQYSIQYGDQDIINLIDSIKFDNVHH